MLRSLLTIVALLLAHGEIQANGQNFGVDPAAVPGALDGVVCAPAYDWPCAEALSVEWCESRDDPAAVSADGLNYGLFQLWRGHVDGADPVALLDPDTNIRIAYSIWLVDGWTPWACAP